MIVELPKIEGFCFILFLFLFFWPPWEGVVLGQPKRTEGEGRTTGGWIVLGDRWDGKKREQRASWSYRKDDGWSRGRVPALHKKKDIFWAVTGGDRYSLEEKLAKEKRDFSIGYWRETRKSYWVIGKITCLWLVTEERVRQLEENERTFTEAKPRGVISGMIGVCFGFFSTFMLLFLSFLLVFGCCWLFVVCCLLWTLKGHRVVLLNLIIYIHVLFRFHFRCFWFLW